MPPLMTGTSNFSLSFFFVRNSFVPKFSSITILFPLCSMVLGSYAQFMWETEDEEDDSNEIKDRAEASPALVAAF